jgi:endonuclease/exonuclease/phosphatase (EEP) superfamily protein YafD
MHLDARRFVHSKDPVVVEVALLDASILERELAVECGDRPKMIPLSICARVVSRHRARHWVSGPELSLLIASLLVAGTVLWLVSHHERAVVPHRHQTLKPSVGTKTAGTGVS